jgi:hypothetical protein
MDGEWELDMKERQHRVDGWLGLASTYNMGKYKVHSRSRAYICTLRCHNGKDFLKSA